MAEETEKPETAEVKPATTSDGRIRVQAPSGKFGTIPADKAEYAAANGYRIEGEQEYAAREYAGREGLVGAAKAFGENLLSSGTLGASDVVAGAIGGDEYRHNRSLRELAFPTASTAGEVAGMVLPALIPGGAEAEGAAHAAQAAEEGGSLLSRAARGIGTAVRNSPAGLAMKGGEAVSELAGRGLEHLGLEGGSLLSRVATGGIRAAAGGAAEGAAFGAGGALSEAALAPDGDYDSLAQKLWAGAIHGAEFGATVGGGLGVGGELLGAAARKIGGTFSASRSLRELSDAKTLKSAGFQGSDIARITERRGPDAVHDLAEAARHEESIGWADTLSDRAHKFEAARKDAGETLGTMRKSLDEARAPGDGVQVREVINDARKRLIDLQAGSATSAEDRMVAKFSRELKRMSENFPEGQPVSFEAAHDLRQTLDKELTNYGKRRYPMGGQEADPFVQQMRQLRTDLESRFEQDAERVMANTTPEFRAQYSDAKARYGALKEISGISKKRVGSLAGNRDIGLTDTLAGLTGFATLGPKGILMAAANRALRSTQADHIVGKLASELANLDEHVTQSTSRWAANSRKAAKGATEGAAARRAAIKHAIEKTGEAAKVTTSSTLHVRSEAGEQREHVKEYFEKLHAVESEAKSPPGTLVHIPDAPKTQAAAENVRRKQANWLLSEAPKPPATIENPIIARIARQTPPTTVDVLKWMRKVKTIEDPRTALAALEQGRLTTDHVKALEQMPAVLQMFRRAALDQVTSHNADMTYQDRIQLGVLVGVTTDPSLRPESIAAGQAIYQKRQATQSQKPAQPSQPTPTVPGKKPAGFNSAIDQMESNSGRI